MFLKPSEMTNIAIGKNDIERNSISVRGLYMSIERFGKIISEKLPLFPRKPNQENARMYGGIRNGKNSIVLKKFLLDRLVHSNNIDNTNPIETAIAAVEIPMTRLLRRIVVILESKENMKYSFNEEISDSWKFGKRNDIIRYSIGRKMRTKTRA